MSEIPAPNDINSLKRKASISPSVPIPPKQPVPEKLPSRSELMCKYCIKYFTYTAPNKKALITHLKQLHMAELSKEPPEVRMAMLGMTETITKPPSFPSSNPVDVAKSTDAVSNPFASKIKHILMDEKLDNSLLEQIPQKTASNDSNFSKFPSYLFM